MSLDAFHADCSIDIKSYSPMQVDMDPESVSPPDSYVETLTPSVTGSEVGALEGLGLVGSRAGSPWGGTGARALSCSRLAVRGEQPSASLRPTHTGPRSGPPASTAPRTQCICDVAARGVRLGSQDFPRASTSGECGRCSTRDC